MSSSGPERPGPAKGTVTVGVTGHRANRFGELDLELLRARVKEVLERVREAADGRAVRMISALAEGSDRIAAKEAIRLGFRLQGALPFGPAEYEKDFETIHSRREFRELLRKASEVRQIPGSRETREDVNSAYAEVGRMVLKGSDVLLAIWDGKPPRGKGGTAEVVREAIARGLPTIWIRLDPPHAVSLLTAGKGQELAERSLELLRL